jgi:hypothetical protein
MSKKGKWNGKDACRLFAHYAVAEAFERIVSWDTTPEVTDRLSTAARLCDRYFGWDSYGMWCDYIYLAMAMLVIDRRETVRVAAELLVECCDLNSGWELKDGKIVEKGEVK